VGTLLLAHFDNVPIYWYLDKFFFSNSMPFYLPDYFVLLSFQPPFKILEYYHVHLLSVQLNVLWDKTLEMRFLMQKVFSASNKLPKVCILWMQQASSSVRLNVFTAEECRMIIGSIIICIHYCVI
jgi:hypothetical protein